MKPIQSAEEIIREVTAISIIKPVPTSFYISKLALLKAMELYAEQFKYDYSKECKCGEASTGSTWCCNVCGLPISKNSSNEDKWIRCDNIMPDNDIRQPEYSKTVLIADEYKNVMSAYYCKQFMYWIDSRTEEAIDNEVNYWQELPKPPIR